MWFSRDSRTGARRPLTAAVAAVAAAGGLLLASPALGRGPSGDPSLDVRSSALFVDGAADRAAGLPGDDAVAPLPAWHLLVGESPTAGRPAEEPGPDVVPLPPALVGAGVVFAVLVAKRRLTPRRA